MSWLCKVTQVTSIFWALAERSQVLQFPSCAKSLQGPLLTIMVDANQEEQLKMTSQRPCRMDPAVRDARIRGLNLLLETCTQPSRYIIS